MQVHTVVQTCTQTSLSACLEPFNATLQAVSYSKIKYYNSYSYIIVPTIEGTRTQLDTICIFVFNLIFFFKQNVINLVLLFGR